MTKTQFKLKHMHSMHKRAKSINPAEKARKSPVATEFELFVDLAYEEMVFHHILINDRLS